MRAVLHLHIATTYCVRVSVGAGSTVRLVVCVTVARLCAHCRGVQLSTGRVLTLFGVGIYSLCEVLHGLTTTINMRHYNRDNAGRFAPKEYSVRTFDTRTRKDRIEGTALDAVCGAAIVCAVVVALVALLPFIGQVAIMWRVY